MRNYQSFVLLLAVLLLAACKEDVEDGMRLPGYIYFNVSEGTGWGDGNRVTKGGVEAPMLMECSLEGQPIYLHTEVTPTTTADLADGDRTTRGVRYTGDVFTPSTSADATHPKISSFGVYATRQSDNAAIMNFREISPSFGVDTYSGSNYNYLWNTKTENIDDVVWDSGKADFYGYAPYFANNDVTHGLSLSVTNGVPVLAYTVPDNVQNQLDVLTAKDEVNKGEDVELEFTHIMSAIKFNFKYGKSTSDEGANWSTKSGFAWSLVWKDSQNNSRTINYNVTVKTIEIQNVYTTGTWVLGGDPYAASNPARWTRTANTTASFTYSNVNNTPSGSSPVDLNPDHLGNVFMMLPQQVPDNAKIVLTCSLTKEGDSSPSKTMTLEAPLKESDGTTNKEWLPGYTYTYTISLSDVAYVFDLNTATSFNATNVPTTGKNFDKANNTNGAGFVVRSYKIDSKGNMQPVDWKLQHKELVSNVTGSNQTSQTEVWEDGSNGWMHLIDNDGSGTEVTGTHPGAYWDTDHNQPSNATNWYYRLEVGSIMTPVIDLSLYNYDQTKRWTGRTTANCYIVAGPGTYRIPLVYGNAITNGSITTSAYAPGHPADNVLGTFLNYDNQAISSPFIKKDVSGVTNACLVWEEGNGTGTSNTGATGSTAATSGDNAKYGHQYNIGTVVKVIEAIDTYNEAEDHYNTNTSPYESGADYLQFEVSPDNFNYGNAVVGVRAGNTIVWSWHIWITDPTTFVTNQSVTLDEKTVELAGTNIGWVDGNVSKDLEKRNGYLRLVQADTGDILTIDADQVKRNAFTTYFTNVLYQWGRKDPMRGNVDPNDDGSDRGAPRGTAGVQPWTNKYRTTTGQGKGQTSVGQMIQEPNSIYGVARGDLYTTVYYNLWAANLTQTYQSMWGTWQVLGKTIYDPSPVGYIVPPSRYLMSFARDGYREGFAEKTKNDTPPIICDYTHNTDHAKFYASGIRTTSSSYGATARGFRVPGPALLGRGALGFYHTSTPYSNDETYQLHLYFYGGEIGNVDEIDTHDKILGDMAEALSIMPMVYHFEQNITESEEQNSNPFVLRDGAIAPESSLSRGYSGN